MFSIKAKKRNAGNSQSLRKEGEIPAVFYGMGKTSTPISVKNVEFKKIWHKAGESSTVKILMDKEAGGDVDTLIHEVQTDPVTEEPIHVDFLAIDMNKPIRVKVPIEFEGVSEAVKGGLGTMVKVMHEVEVEALPKDLPQKLVVDISKLATLEDQIFISDIKLPEGVTMIANEADVVASVAEQKEEVEEVAAPVDLSAIEVSEKKGKKDLPAGEAGEEAPAEVEKEEKK